MSELVSLSPMRLSGAIALTLMFTSLVAACDGTPTDDSTPVPYSSPIPHRERPCSPEGAQEYMDDVSFFWINEYLGGKSDDFSKDRTEQLQFAYRDVEELSPRCTEAYEHWDAYLDLVIDMINVHNLQFDIEFENNAIKVDVAREFLVDAIHDLEESRAAIDAAEVALKTIAEQ